MKIRVLLSLGVLLLLFAEVAWASFSGKVEATTNYVWRGVSQTQNRGAVQGTLTYDILDSGFYASLFGSNVDFGEELDLETLEMPPIARSEIDYAAGYSHDFKENWSMDIGIQQYTYPGAAINNYKEAYGSVNYKIVTVDATYTNNLFNTETNGYYGGIGIKYELFKDSKSIVLKDFFARGHIGYSIRNIDVDGGNYTDYFLSLTKVIKGVNFELSWTDTSGRRIEDNVSSSRIFFAISKEF